MTTTKTKTQTKCLKTWHILYFWNPDDLFISNMMIDTSPWSSCSRQSPWLPCFGHTISSIRPSVSPFQDFVCYQLNLHWESPKNYIQLAQHCVTSSWSCFLGHSHYRTAMVGTWWYWVSIRRYQTWMKIVKQITQHDQRFIANIMLRRGGI